MSGIDPDSGVQVDSYDLALNTAIQGLGIALGMDPFVNRDLMAGTLVEVFPEKRVYTRGDWYLACRSEKATSEKITVFREWLLSQIETDQSMARERPSPHVAGLR